MPLAFTLTKSGVPSHPSYVHLCLFEIFFIIILYIFFLFFCFFFSVIILHIMFIVIMLWRPA